MPTERHVVSVVIPTVGRPTLQGCLDALAGQSRPPDQVIPVLDREWRGPSWARNAGIAQAVGDLIAFTDDDCRPPPDWIERLIAALDEAGAAGAGGSLAETDPLLEAIRARRPLPTARTRDPGGLVGGAGNVMYRRGWLDRLKAEDGHVFDERFRSTGEDWELVLRLRLRGAELVYEPVHVTHVRRASPMGHLRQQFARGCGVADLYLAHRRLGGPVSAQPSRIWGVPHRAGAGLLSALWHKGVGPFDVSSFRRPAHFLTHWVGEKVQGLGFLYGLGRAAVRWW